MKKRVTGGIVCGDVGYDDLNPMDKSIVTGALRRGATRREVMGYLIASGATIAAAGHRRCSSRAGGIRWLVPQTSA